jgi:hypothetical protein
MSGHAPGNKLASAVSLIAAHTNYQMPRPPGWLGRPTNYAPQGLAQETMGSQRRVQSIVDSKNLAAAAADAVIAAGVDLKTVVGPAVPSPVLPALQNLSDSVALPLTHDAALAQISAALTYPIRVQFPSSVSSG